MGNFNLYLEIVQNNKYHEDFTIYDESFIETIKQIFKDDNNKIISLLTAGGIALLMAIAPALNKDLNYQFLNKELKQKITKEQFQELKEKKEELNLAIKKH
jgi:hypothetical protein